MSCGTNLLHPFGQNGEQLGVRPASKLFVDESDGVAKRAWAYWQFPVCVPHSLSKFAVAVTLSPTRPILPSRSVDAVRLSAIELLYVFKTRPLAGPQQQSPHRAHTVRTRS